MTTSSASWTGPHVLALTACMFAIIVGGPSNEQNVYVQGFLHRFLYAFHDVVPFCIVMTCAAPRFVPTHTFLAALLNRCKVQYPGTKVLLTALSRRPLAVVETIRYHPSLNHGIFRLKIGSR